MAISSAGFLDQSHGPGLGLHDDGDEEGDMELGEDDDDDDGGKAGISMARGMCVPRRGREFLGTKTGGGTAGHVCFVNSLPGVGPGWKTRAVGGGLRGIMTAKRNGDGES